VNDEWGKTLVKAAARRATITTIDGKQGVLVFAPNPNRTRTKKPRHGDPTKCGVSFSRVHPHWIVGIDPTEIIGIDPEPQPPGNDSPTGPTGPRAACAPSPQRSTPRRNQ